MAPGTIRNERPATAHPRARPGATRRPRAVLALALAATLVAALAGVAPALCGVRLIDPGEDMMPLPPQPQWMQRPAAQAEGPPVRVAVAGADAGILAGMTAQAAPFELVAPGDGPDLVFDPGARQATSKGEVIAYDVGPADLPAVIDRTAFAEAIAQRAAARPQPISLSSGAAVRRSGERVEIGLADMAHRALILVAVSGDGLVRLLYPIGADPRVIDAPAFEWTLEVRAPFGADLLVAITAAQPMDALERGVKRLSHYRGAGELAKLIALTAPPDARIGVAALLSAP